MLWTTQRDKYFRGRNTVDFRCPRCRCYKCSYKNNDFKSLLLYRSSTGPFLHFSDSGWSSFYHSVVAFWLSTEFLVLALKSLSWFFFLIFVSPQKILFHFCDDLQRLHQAYAAHAETKWKQTRPTSSYNTSQVLKRNGVGGDVKWHFSSAKLSLTHISNSPSWTLNWPVN